MEPLKEMFNKKFFEELSSEFKKADKNFNAAGFLKDMMDGLGPLSLNERMRKTSVILKKYLPDDFKKSTEIMYRVIPGMRRGYTKSGFSRFCESLRSRPF